MDRKLISWTNIETYYGEYEGYETFILSAPKDFNLNKVIEEWLELNGWVRTTKSGHQFKKEEKRVDWNGVEKTYTYTSSAGTWYATENPQHETLKEFWEYVKEKYDAYLVEFEQL